MLSFFVLSANVNARELSVNLIVNSFFSHVKNNNLRLIYGNSCEKKKLTSGCRVVTVNV